MSMTITRNETNQTSLSDSARREVRAWLGRRNLQQKDLAEALGLTQSSVSLRLSGKMPFTLDDLASIASWLDITLGELLGAGVVNAKNPRPHMEDGDSDDKLL